MIIGILKFVYRDSFWNKNKNILYLNKKDWYEIKHLTSLEKLNNNSWMALEYINMPEKEYAYLLLRFSG